MSEIVIPDGVLPPFTRRTLDQVDLSRPALGALLERGAVVEPVWGAHLDARRTGDPLAIARAAALVLPPHVVACRGLAAFIIHGIDPRGPAFDPSPVPMTGLVPTSNRVPKWAGASIFEAPLDAHDVMEVGGVLVTTPERTALDCAHYLSPPMALAVLDRMAGLGLVDPEVLLVRIEEFRGDRWVGRARYLIVNTEPDAESFGESWLRLRLLEAGFPRPQVQIPVMQGSVEVFRMDLGWEELATAGEYDGAEVHGPEQEVADAARRTRLEEEFGWRFWSARREHVLGWSWSWSSRSVSCWGWRRRSAAARGEAAHRP